MENPDLLTLIKRIKAIANIGLLYNQNEYDRERYAEMLQISYEMLHQVTGHDLTALQNIYFENKDYPTAKVDIRGLIIQDNKILLVKEGADGKWSLPGGWADIGYSPKEVVIKECKEETGLEVTVEKLLAVFDKKFHPHPYEPFYIYKLVFYCKAITEKISKGFDVLDVGYFSLDNLPVLSENRILKSQLQLLFDLALADGSDTYFD